MILWREPGRLRLRLDKCLLANLVSCSQALPPGAGRKM
jgi:hypothetical protein